MSETPSTPTRSEAKDWTARESGPRRSIFGNYSDDSGDIPGPETADQSSSAPAGSETADIAMARAFIYRHLAKAFEYPTDVAWLELTDPMQFYSLDTAVTVLANPQLTLALGAVREQFENTHSENYHDLYVSTFGHAARGPVPMNEIEFGEPKADALFQPHRLADLAAFYRAYGLEMGDDVGERHDHLSVELEFMSVLSAKEAYALQGKADADALATCRDSQTKFLREHLGRWTPAFSRVLTAHTGPSCLLAAYASLLRTVVEADCARLAVPTGSADMVVRQVDEAAESLCDTCGLAQPPPGAT